MDAQLRLGAQHAVTAAAAFALTGVCVKAASATASNEIVVFFRCAVSLLALLPWVLRRGLDSLKTARPGGHLLRAALGCAAMYCFFYTIAEMHLAEAMLLTYSTPLWIPFIAWVWISEKPPAIVFAASALGLAGLALIVKPATLKLDWLPGLVGIASGIFAAMAMVNIRRISNTEPAERIVFYFALLGTVISAVPLIWAWQTPALQTLMQLTGAGLFATIGQLYLTPPMPARRLPASAPSPTLRSSSRPCWPGCSGVKRWTAGRYSAPSWSLPPVCWPAGSGANPR